MIFSSRFHSTLRHIKWKLEPKTNEPVQSVHHNSSAHLKVVTGQSLPCFSSCNLFSSFSFGISLLLPSNLSLSLTVKSFFILIWILTIFPSLAPSSPSFWQYCSQTQGSRAYISGAPILWSALLKYVKIPLQWYLVVEINCGRQCCMGGESDHQDLCFPWSPFFPLKVLSDPPLSLTHACGIHQKTRGALGFILSESSYTQQLDPLA